MDNLKQKLILQMYLLRLAHNFFLNNNYLPIVSPKIVPFKDDEEPHLIKVQIPEKSENLFLSRSPQLYKEIACLHSSTGKVYEIGSVFRGEPFGGGRRANEFIGIDVEIKTDNLTELIISLEQFILSLKENDHIVNYIRRYINSPNFPEEIIVVGYDEALRHLGVSQIGSEEEKLLSRYINLNSKKNRWVVLIEFPVAKREFYQIKGDKTDSFDLIAEWEICSGGLRRQDVDEYTHFLDKMGWSTKEMELYIKIKKEHATNTGGYGIGLERLVGAIINDMSIANIQPYKRVPEEPILF